MLTPKELYAYYTLNVCLWGGTSYEGVGTPYELPKLVRFLKHLKYPCFSKIPNVNLIAGTGANKLALPFKFTTRLDPEAFTEIQPAISSGTSHGIRNACDLTRSCDVEFAKDYTLWESKMATEYLEHFGKNSLFDCLMMLGPDIVLETEAENRGTGCGPLDCWVGSKNKGRLGAPHFCKTDPGSSVVYCGSCDFCPDNPPPNLPCCSSDCCTYNQRC